MARINIDMHITVHHGSYNFNTKQTTMLPEQKIYMKDYGFISIHERAMMANWCSDTLYHGGHYEPNWWVKGNTFYFTDEKEYMMFLLRWS